MCFFIAFVIFIAGFIIYNFRHDSDIVVRTIIITLILTASCCYFTYTESGKRIVKDFTSNVSGGIPRHVRVYDINGELIEEYTGTFDMETNNNNYILFDDENGLRHIIYYTTGTIIVDELEK